MNNVIEDIYQPKIITCIVDASILLFLASKILIENFLNK